IGILAAIAVPNFLNAQLRSKIAKAESEMRSIATALESYRLDNNIYPPYFNENGVARNPLPARLAPLTTPIAYMSSIPQDPFVYGPPGTRIVESQNEVYTTYDYTDAWTRIHFQGLTILPPQARCSEYKLVSFGPDGLNEY